ncbi:MAG TPA: glycosyltransferase family 4 protein [Trebonia sp.]|jgi:glycosyltransferase involved in cell wall biosynthesis|nr:glycosyltransferase family 4 protein [Trebonia sp.]
MREHNQANSRQKNDLRIAMIAYTFYPVDARVKRAAEALTESGHQVDVFTIACSGMKANSDGGPSRSYFLRVKKKQTGLGRYAFEYGAFFLWAFVLVSLLHARRRYDVVYVHNMPNFLVFAGLIPKIGGAKIVLDVHDPAAELLAVIRGRDLPSWVKHLANAEERISISFSDAVITVNESMRRRLSAMSSRPVSVAMNLPDPGRFIPPARPGDNGSFEWIVYSGSIAHRNGVDLIVRAIPLLAGDFPSLRFRIIGEGSALESIVQLAEDLGVADRVEFRELVPYGQIPYVLSDAIAGISPQRGGVFGSLVFSMKVAEYIALGLPVICSGIATMRHYFSDDDLLFFEPDNSEDLARAIRVLLTDPAAAEGRAARSRVKLDELDWPAQKKKLVETVEDLAGSKVAQQRNKGMEIANHA